MKVRVAALIIEDGRLLTMQYEYGGQMVYNLPGGNLEFGEQMRQALERELEEELQINCEIGAEPAFTAEIHTAEKDTLHVIFGAKILSGDLMLNAQETSAKAICWLSLNALESVNLYPNVGLAIQEYSNNKLINKHLGTIEQPWY